MRTCEVSDCDRPHKAHGLCQSHYDRDRGDGRQGEVHRHRVLEQRARNRATAALLRAYPDEYQQLLAAAREAVQAQADGATVLFRPGPTAADEDEAARQRLLAIACPRCAAKHDGLCPTCGRRC